MKPHCILSKHTPLISIMLLMLLVLWYVGVAKGFNQLDNSIVYHQQDQGKSHQPDDKTLADQIKELQNQIKALQVQIKVTQTPRIIAAGTASFERPRSLDNATSVLVKLNADVTAQIGDRYIVLLTPRVITDGYPFLVPFWKMAPDGFNITLVDTTLGPGTTGGYANRNKTHLIDWIVVQK